MEKHTRFPNPLLISAFIVGLFFPFLIWKGIIPDILRWIADAAIAVMVVGVVFRILVFDKFPVPFWFIIFLSIVGVSISLLSGQGTAPTIWGWWLMFQYPMVGLFCYLQPGWPKSYPKYLLIAMIAIMAIEILVQTGQFLTGEAPGDNLAGTFGKNGTGNLVLFLILVACFSLGQWLHTRQALALMATLVLGFASSVLGEMKLFYIAVIILTVIGMFNFLLQGKQLWRLIPFLFLVVVVMAAFIPLYNMIVPSASEKPLQGYITDPKRLFSYLSFVSRSTAGEEYYYDIGRNYALTYGWEKISGSPLDMAFGWGLGARSESISLGFAGRALTEGELGISSGTSLLILMQETGLVGMVSLAGFILGIIVILFKHIHAHPTSQANGLRYGLIIFTVLWPLWLWYNQAWTLRVPMLLYWSTLGYVLREAEFFFSPISTTELHEEPVLIPNEI